MTDTKPKRRNLQHWTVLLVDDNDDNLGVARATLQMHNVTVHSASNGQQALEILETVKPTFILLDLSMPIMDGWETLQVLRNRPDMANVPVIALTAHVMVPDRERILEAGFDGFIPKPFRIKTLVDDIETWIVGKYGASVTL